VRARRARDHRDGVKVPELDLSFWVIKLGSTAMGEALSDFLVHRLYPPLAVLLTLVAFGSALSWQWTRRHYETYPYWSAVIVISVFGTMAADVAHVVLFIPYLVSALGFGLALVVLFTLWYRVEGTVSIHSIASASREFFYWAAVLTTFALGTALGDLSATTGHFGFFSSALLYGTLFTLIALAFRVRLLGPVVTFWSCYILTRPLGASLADWLGVSPSRGGLNLGPGSVALAFSAVLVALVVSRARAERNVTRQLLSPLG
jgi:uncharacterized membrane-anchored protein